jgi:hypothetical protein
VFTHKLLSQLEETKGIERASRTLMGGKKDFFSKKKTFEGCTKLESLKKKFVLVILRKKVYAQNFLGHSIDSKG